jgi:hypothetical protein
MEVASPPAQPQAGYTNGHASPNVNGLDHINGNGLDVPVASTTGAQPIPFDTSAFRSYLLALLPPVLGATPAELEDGVFSDPDFEERVRVFAVQPGGPIYVAKIVDDLHGAAFSIGYSCASCDFRRVLGYFTVILTH